MAHENLKLSYTIICDDVRLEIGNKLSLMGIFQNVMVERLPFSILKFAVVQHWHGEGNYTSEVRILSPDRLNIVVNSQPTPIQLKDGGFTDNISFFVNVGFPESGTFWIQTLVDSTLYEEIPFVVTEINQMPPALQEEEDFPEMLN